MCKLAARHLRVMPRTQPRMDHVEAFKAPKSRKRERRPDHRSRGGAGGEEEDVEEVAVAEEGDEAGAVGMDVDGASRGGGGGWRWSRPDLQRINMRGSGKWRGGGEEEGGWE